MIISIGGFCNWKDCGEPAVRIAAGREQYNGHPIPGVYCERHAASVAHEGSPEYIDICPNCECVSGVN